MILLRLLDDEQIHVDLRQWVVRVRVRVHALHARVYVCVCVIIEREC